MKRVTEFIKPLLLLIFGSLALLFYMDYLQLQDEYLAFGIVAVIFSAYYLVAGILTYVLGNRLNNSLQLVFDILNVSLFPLILFFMRILNMRRLIQADAMSVNDWIVYITFFVATVTLIVFYMVYRFTKQPVMGRIAFLCGGILVLTLVVELVLNNTVGSLPLIQMALYGIYTYVLFSTMARTVQGSSPREIE